jgi:hypothetical protein
MTRNTADASPTTCTRSRDKDVWIIGFATPLWGFCCLIIFNKWEIKIAVKNVPARQANCCFKI